MQKTLNLFTEFKKDRIHTILVDTQLCVTDWTSVHVILKRSKRKFK